MAYKIINEWWSKDGKSHEITIYKYNYSFDLVMRYNYSAGDKRVAFTSQSFGSKVGMLEGSFEVVKYKERKFTEKDLHELLKPLGDAFHDVIKEGE